MKDLKFCRYRPSKDIHLIDYSGCIDLEEGTRRIELLKEYFEHHARDGKILKVTMDARRYIKHSPETHDMLAKMAREVFTKNFNIKLAVLDAHYAQQLSDEEAWFRDKEEAFNWLVK